MTDEQQKKTFTRQLMSWHGQHNTRSLPWKGIKDPYRIWLSEIILQQTRAEQGLPYYERFTGAYPTVGDLAAAPDEEVFRLWQGLGYYNRCKNLLATARHIAGELSGRFPGDYEAILSLKGIGPYTAAAIASFAYGLPHAVVDGNVYRVLARVFGIDTPFDSTEGKKQFQVLAGELLDTEDPAGYNQAIMDLGATVCTPQNPACEVCPMQKICFAFRQGAIGELPVKSKKIQVKQRFFHYVLLQDGDRLWIRKRQEGIWSNLFEPYLVEAEAPLDSRGLAGDNAFRALDVKQAPAYEGLLTHRLTHQLIEVRFFTLSLAGEQVQLPDDGLWVPFKRLNDYAFPRPMVLFFEKKAYF